MMLVGETLIGWLRTYLTPMRSGAAMPILSCISSRDLKQDHLLNKLEVIKVNCVIHEYSCQIGVEFGAKLASKMYKK